MLNKSLIRYIILVSFFLLSFHLHANRIRDLTTIQGIRCNQLIGYGLVVGLDGTGDQTNQIPYTTHALKNMLSQLGISFSNEKNAKFRNIAAVIVTAKSPNFIHIGQSIDVYVSSIGDARSLQGGTLLMTPLRGINNKIYAVAQGNILINKQQNNFKKIPERYSFDSNLNNGKIINGAIIERETHVDFGQHTTLNLQLNNENFTVAQEISDKINTFYPKSAIALNSKTVKIKIPSSSIAQVEMLATIQNINVTIPVQDAKIIINTKTGNVIMNQEIKINSCIISHDKISMSIINNEKQTTKNISPVPIIKKFNNNWKTDKNKYDTNINKKNNIKHIESTANLSDIICSLNSLGITTTELISILQDMRDANCLHAKLEII